MHWKYNSGSPSNLPLILGQGFYFTREGLTWILFWSQMKQKLQDTKRLRLVRDFILYLIPVWSWDSWIFWKVFAAELMYLQENGHEQVIGDAFLAMLPVLWNWRETEKEVGEWISPLLFSLWQKLWTFGDNHSWHLFYLFGSLFFFYKILKSKDTQFLKKDTELANLEKLKLKPAVNEANERKGKLYPSI